MPNSRMPTNQLPILRREIYKRVRAAEVEISAGALGGVPFHAATSISLCLSSPPPVPIIPASFVIASSYFTYLFSGVT